MSESGPPSSGLRSSVVSAAGWSTLGEIVSRVATPVIFLILARFLSPEDFGIVAAAVVVVAFSQAFATFGFPRALVQRRIPDDEVQATSDSIFWVNLGLSIAAYVLVFVGSDWLASLFGDPRVSDVLRVQTLQVVVIAIYAVPQSLFERTLRFGPLFASRTVNAVAPGIVAVPSVMLGMGYWALTLGAVVGSLLTLAVLWRASDWKPRSFVDRTVLKAVTPFAVWVSLEGILIWGISWADTLVVGTVLDPSDLGTYRFASLVIATLFAAVLSPLQPVLFSAFSRLHSKGSDLEVPFLRSVRLVSFLALPVGVGLFMVADTAVEALLPSIWSAAGPALAYLGLAMGLAWTVGINGDLYRAMGRPATQTKIMLGSLVVYFPVYIWAAERSLQTLLVSRLVLVVLGVTLHAVVAKQALRLNRFWIARELWPMAIATFVMWIAVSLAETVLAEAGAGIRLATDIAVGIVVYIAVVLVSDRRDLIYVRDVFRQQRAPASR